MVDMNMLLLTFFMFCTTLGLPQTMDIVMPTREKTDNGPLVAKSKALTLLLGEENKIYYYAGEPDYQDYTSLKVTDYTENGLRNILLERNKDLFAKSQELKRKKMEGKISERDFKEQMKELKKSNESIVVMIKPTDASSFQNLVDVLDEMQICNVNKYAILEMEKGDIFLLDNYKQKGALTAGL